MMEMLAASQAKMKKRYGPQAEMREFSAGDRVLSLCPLVTSPFQAKFCGPFTVVKRISDKNYLISTRGRRKPIQLFHVNLLKPCYAHSSSAPGDVQQEPMAWSPVLGADKVDADSVEYGRCCSGF